MRTALFLRAAAIIALLQFTAHTFLFVHARPGHGPEEVAVVETMRAHLFDFGGRMHSYWDFYFGYGLFAALNCLIEALLFWFLAGLARDDARRLRPVIALFLAANLAYAGLVLRYFFLVPLGPDLLVATCLALAWLSAGQRRAAADMLAA